MRYRGLTRTCLPSGGNVKNPIFKAHLAVLEKTALGHDPHAVLSQMPHEDSGHLRRGLALVEGAKGIGSSAKDLLGATYHGISNALTPSPGAGSGMVSKGLGHVGDFAMKHPSLSIGAAALTPILASAFDTSQKRNEDELMNADITRPIHASLDEFLEKKAELYSMSKEAAKPSPKPPWLTNSLLKQVANRAARGSGNVTRAESKAQAARAQDKSREQQKRDMKQIARSAAGAVKKSLPPEQSGWANAGEHIIGGLGKGFGSALGGSMVGLLAHGIGTGVDALRDHFMIEPKRKALVESLLRSDPVLSDAIARHPDSITLVKESYGTMARFAPTLSLDVNAVRSFLREAVLGGSGVNYATIKNLVDTERSIADSKPNYMGGH